MGRLAVAVALFALMASVPASAMPHSCKHNSGHPDCHPEWTYSGRSVPISRGWGYNHYAYSPLTASVTAILLTAPIGNCPIGMEAWKLGTPEAAEQ